MPGREPITYFNRHTGGIETEAVYGEAFLRLAYESAPGRLLLHAFIKRAFFSQWYGRRMDSPASRAKIAPFIEKFRVDTGEFACAAEDFGSFNEFFARKLRPDARPVDARPDAVVFPADGRHLVIPDVSVCDHFFIKGQRFEIASLLGHDTTLVSKFSHAAVLISRLCPTDYHRFHFPCGGVADAPRLLNGPLFSVSPIALRVRPTILWENKRFLTRLRTRDLGEVLLMEIGATNVGSVTHTSNPGVDVAKGQEKGFFRFGGSSFITIFEPGRVRFADDLLEHSAQAREVYAKMGDHVATRLK